VSHAEDDFAVATAVDDYIAALFAPTDEPLRSALADAEAAGLPSINISPVEGKLLWMLTRLVGARSIVEVGTLGGFSTIWLARAAGPEASVVTLELDPHHAEVARRNLDRAGVGDRVDVRVGPAADTLRAMVAAGEGPFDLFFIDADKTGYPEYLDLCLQLAQVGSLILADNVIWGGAVADETATGPVEAIRAYNAAIAGHPRLDSILVPLMRERLDGLAISLVAR
jgi:predicted O-methyltransferase YrrM